LRLSGRATRAYDSAEETEWTLDRPQSALSETDVSSHYDTDIMVLCTVETVELRLDYYCVYNKSFLMVC